MPDDATVRAVLREHGVAVPARGKLSAEHHRQYEELTHHAAPAGDAWEGADDDADIVAGVVPPAAEPGEADAGPGVGPEDRPRRPRRRRPGLGERLRSAGSRKAGGSKGKQEKASRPKHPRVPVDRIISRGWGTLAKLTATVDAPVSRTFQLQAPIAGLVLEDVVRGTVVDKVLQPVARAEERGELVIALAGPPLLVAAIERAQGLEEPARSMRLAILAPMLEESLSLWVRIAGDKMEIAAARLEEDAATREQVQRLIAQIFPQATVQDMPAQEPAGAAM